MVDGPVSGNPYTSISSWVNEGAADCADPSSKSRDACFALSTSGWSKGLISMMRPATAMAYSHISMEPANGASTVARHACDSPPKDESSRITLVVKRTRVQCVRIGDNRQESATGLARGFGHQLLNPIGETVRGNRVIGEYDFVDSVFVGHTQKSAQPRGRISLGVFGNHRRRVGRLIEQCRYISTGQAAGHQAERRQRRIASADVRSEEHTSELQSRGQLVCRRLLEKK